MNQKIRSQAKFVSCCFPFSWTLGILFCAPTILAQSRSPSVQKAQVQRSPPSIKAPQAAAITLNAGLLTVSASDSDLRSIFQMISQESGMIIEGQVSDTRVFGIYGPKPPQIVLTELLDGLGYNILMVGVSDRGMPNRLVLTHRTGGPSPPTPDSAASGKPPGNTPSPASQPDGEPTLGPGAIAHPPPEPTTDPDTRLQQNLQRLQKMRQQTVDAPPR